MACKTSKRRRTNWNFARNRVSNVIICNFFFSKPTNNAVLCFVPIRSVYSHYLKKKKNFNFDRFKETILFDVWTIGFNRNNKLTRFNEPSSVRTAIVSSAAAAAQSLASFSLDLTGVFRYCSMDGCSSWPCRNLECKDHCGQWARNVTLSPGRILKTYGSKRRVVNKYDCVSCTNRSAP